MAIVCIHIWSHIFESCDEVRSNDTSSMTEILFLLDINFVSEISRFQSPYYTNFKHY